MLVFFFNLDVCFSDLEARVYFSRKKLSAAARFQRATFRSGRRYLGRHSVTTCSVHKKIAPPLSGAIFIPNERAKMLTGFLSYSFSRL